MCYVVAMFRQGDQFLSTSILLLSHSKKLVDGLADLINELTGSQIRIATAGGEKELGVNPTMVLDAIDFIIESGSKEIIIFGDIGSAFISATSAIEMMSVDCVVKIVDAPLVEGSIAAAMTLSIGSNIDEAIQAGQDAYKVTKL